jgi:molecular chaperone GrpE (heat shock protein)
MNLFSFITKRGRRDDPLVAVTDELSRLSQSVEGMENKLKNISNLDLKMNNAADLLAGCALDMRKLERHQKEASIQLDEINELLNNGGDTALLLDSLIGLADLIENFYLFASEDRESPLFGQGELMWKAARKKLDAAGLKIINGEGMPLDSRLHSPVRTDFDESLPNGHVIGTLASGYTRDGEVIRRASVIVNKKDKERDDI